MRRRVQICLEAQDLSTNFQHEVGCPLFFQLPAFKKDKWNGAKEEVWSRGDALSSISQPVVYVPPVVCRVVTGVTCRAPRCLLPGSKTRMQCQYANNGRRLGLEGRTPGHGFHGLEKKTSHPPPGASHRSLAGFSTWKQLASLSPVTSGGTHDGLTFMELTHHSPLLHTSCPEPFPSSISNPGSGQERGCLSAI